MKSKVSRTTLEKAEELYRDIRAGDRSKDAELKKRGIELFSEIIDVDSEGRPKDPINQAIVAAIEKKSEAVRADIARAMSRPTGATPLDFYRIYYDVLSDSGVPGLVDPAALSGIPWWLIAVPREASCGICGVCSACSACSACAGCGISLVFLTVGAGIAGFTTAVISAFRGSWAGGGPISVGGYFQ